MLKILVLLFVLVTIIFILTKGSPKDTLILAHVVFRHGDKTPQHFGFYPNSPYANETFYPYGKEGLTLRGKKRSYKLGTSLRRRYADFLGDVYYPELLEAVSSDSARTVASLQCVLTGLFPPNPKWKLEDNLNWEPVNFEVLKLATDDLLLPLVTCPRILRVEARKESKVHNLYSYLSEHTGYNVTKFGEVYALTDYLDVLSEFGYELPDWTKSVYPELLRQLSLEFWQDMVRQIIPGQIGNLLRKINEDSIKKIRGDLDRKLFVYSAHDFNIVAFMGAIGAFDGRKINYSAYVSVEIHLISGEHFVKVYFENYEQAEPEMVRIQSCGGQQHCPLHKFVEITEEFYLPQFWCNRFD